MSNIKPVMITSNQSWIEGDAVRQLENTANLPGMVRAVGLPDLHPGKGIPIGAAFLSDGIVYPHLVGNDIGCGMGLWQTDMRLSKFKLDKSVKRLKGFEDPWDGDRADVLAQHGLPETLSPKALGTIGSGNHFAEFQRVETVSDEAAFSACGLNQRQILLLVHSGSRGLGHAILEAHIRKHSGAGLKQNSAHFNDYITKHDQAVIWAVANRKIIAERFMTALGAGGICLLDICHNSVTQHQDRWLHRKGAAPSDKGLVVIPGSRGTLSYIVRPRLENADLSLFSLAHGAGRKWKRSDAKARLSRRYSVADLTRTKLGGRVICEDKALIYEEAPEAYKDVAVVIDDLQCAGLIDVIATLRPLISYKTRRR
ncbi:MAG: RNA ligase RtcB family protein [Robiginitomaculum sp.]|nr:RNA ligase RtcB family protein [Robiginitomaculum sp.]